MPTYWFYGDDHATFTTDPDPQDAASAELPDATAAREGAAILVDLSAFSDPLDELVECAVQNWRNRAGVR